HQLYVFARRRNRGLASAAAEHYAVRPLSNFRSDGFREWFGGDAFVSGEALTNCDLKAGDRRQATNRLRAKSLTYLPACPLLALSGHACELGLEADNGCRIAKCLLMTLSRHWQSKRTRRTRVLHR